MRRYTLIAITVLVLLGGCSRAADQPAPARRSVFPMTGPLIAASVSMKAAWEFPENPLTDKSLDDSKLSQEIRRGF